MSPATHEYKAVELRGRLVLSGQGATLVSEQINAMAMHGWRLVTVDQDMAYFERSLER